MHDHSTRYSLLGPVEVVRDGTALALGPRQRRVLLIRLLIEDGRPVSLAQLCQDLWQGSQPTGAVSSVRAHISRLRSVLEPVPRNRSTLLVNGPAGYALKVPDEARDTTRFEMSVARARQSMRRGQLDVARKEIDDALGLWRGEALGETAEHAFAARETARLNTARQDATELQATILIKQGDLEQAIGVAENLTAGAPLREASWALLMCALYGAGRSVEALRQYERFRTFLAQELGLDPSPGLSNLHTAILRHDTQVLGEPRPAGPAAALSPAQATPAAAPLVGRAEETAQLAALLRAAAAGRTQWAVVSGEPGSGKTRLLEEMTAGAENAGFTVARASGGQALSESLGISLACPATQLLDALRRERPGTGPDTRPENTTGARPGEDRLAALVRELAQGPALCVIDDLDWAPPDFHDLLRRLTAVLRDAPVAVVCALRNTDGPAASGLLAELARHGATRLHLEPLSVADVAELLAARGERASAEEATALHRRAEGNPFTLGELLRLPSERRMGPTARVPAAVRSVVQARLAELAAPARTMLCYAAADGAHLDIGLLADVQGMSQDRLLPLVDAAVTARVLVWDTDPDDCDTGRYRFPELAREVVLSALTPSSRQLLHASLARELAGRDDADPARLARQLRAAGPMAPVADPDPVRHPTPEQGR
ncbi:ATPase-like protein [Streptomyces bingchenggensis BCW-1]|uniref:ATPase-like protein n=2 Tax=Streptomyces TaxID=1883 RepID=D7BQ18_STRBB|nr:MULTISPECIES: BTAD domain-containing putative transcriptional regulator [Streptomyces]ADI05025.1 ATPase-like protein [Streptomyces bingchenggensis BCW-1]